MENGLFTTMWSENGHRVTVNHSKSRSAIKGDAVYLAALEGHYVLQFPSAKSNVKFRQVVSPIEPIKDRNLLKMSRTGQ